MEALKLKLKRLFWACFATAILCIIAVGMYAITNYLYYCISHYNLWWIPAVVVVGVATLLYREIDNPDEEVEE